MCIRDRDALAPAEIPCEMNSFKTQQFRWAKGSAQTARKLLPIVLRAKIPFKVKLEAVFHLTNNFAYLFLMILAVLQLPNIGSISGVLSQAGKVRSGLTFGAPCKPSLASLSMIRRETSTPSRFITEAAETEMLGAAKISAADRPITAMPPRIPPVI